MNSLIYSASELRIQQTYIRSSSSTVVKTFGLIAFQINFQQLKKSLAAEFVLITNNFQSLTEVVSLDWKRPVGLVIWIEAMRRNAGKDGWKMAEFRVRMVAVDLGLQQIMRTEWLSDQLSSSLSTSRRSTQKPVSTMTIHRRLRERNLRSRRPLCHLPLTPAHCWARLQWCMAQSGWNDADWGRIVFSDESRF